MSTFALDVSSNPSDIIGALNYALANLSDNTNLLEANVLVANITTGEITTTSTNAAGYTNNTLVSYLYQYMDVKYANTSTGSSGFTSNSALTQYYGIRNTTSTTISNNPVDYVWFQATGGFGTTKSLWYQTIGGRQIDFQVSNIAPASSYVSVPDMPTANSTPLNLDTITSAQNNQIVNVNAYYQANVTPATPAGGTYDFTTFTLTAPAGWTDTIPSFVANTSVYVSQAAFVGNTNATAVPPATDWTTPAVYSSQFQGNTGASGPRGFLPMGFVITASDPTTYGNVDFTTAFSSSRNNASPPIGLGFVPIANDTAQFAYSDLFTGNTITTVQQYDGSGWTEVVGDVISGGLFVPGSINANTLNANQVYALTVASTNANVGNVASAGFWMDNVSGDARFAGNTNIGNNLTIGNNAVIGGNLTVTGLVTAGSLQSNTVATSTISLNSVSSGSGSTSDNQVTFASPRTDNNTSSGIYYVYPWTSATAANVASPDTVYVNSNFGAYFTTSNVGTYKIYSYLLRQSPYGSNPTGNVKLQQLTTEFNYTGLMSGTQTFYMNSNFTYLDNNFVSAGNTQVYRTAWSVYGPTANTTSNVTQLTFYQGSVVSQILKR